MEAKATQKDEPTPQGPKPFNKRPKGKFPNTIPKPKFMAKTETPLTNDPLWKESFVLDGETGFVSQDASKQINADAVGFTHLIDQEYKALTDVDKFYSKSVPASAHAYYHIIIIYWYKIALIAQKRGTSCLDQDRLVNFVKGYGSAVICAGAGEYLEGLGDYTDLTGVKHLLRAPEPNNDGHYGRATAETHGFYETLPAPAIAFERIAQDFLASQRGAQPNDHWVPAGVAPIVVPPPAPQAHDPQRREREERRRAEEAGRPDPDEEGGAAEIRDEGEEQVEERRAQPTVNLLGWRKPKLLSANQYREMDNVLDEDNNLINARYAIRRELFEFVARRLRECKRYKMAPLPSTTGGSQVQQVIWSPHNFSVSRFQQAIEADGTACSRTTMPLRAAIAAKVMCYRTLRRELENDEGVAVNTWACFHFGGYTEVPQKWRNNRNALVQQGYEGLINYTPFRT